MSELEKASIELAVVYDDYFDMSKKLREDLEVLIDNSSDEPHWRRNFLRTSFPLIEAYAGSLRSICLVLAKHSEFHISKRQQKLLEDESKLSTEDRLKETMKLAFRIHELEEKPIFSDERWVSLRNAIGLRDRLMHPKRSSDLDLESKEWDQAFYGITWIIDQLFGFFEQVHKKYGPDT